MQRTLHGHPPSCGRKLPIRCKPFHPATCPPHCLPHSLPPNLAHFIVCFADTSWVRDPSEYLARFPTADFFISTDCLSAAVEEAWQPRHNQPRCGHIPGNGWGRAFNTGAGQKWWAAGWVVGGEMGGL